MQYPPGLRVSPQTETPTVADLTVRSLPLIRCRYCSGLPRRTVSVLVTPLEAEIRAVIPDGMLRP